MKKYKVNGMSCAACSARVEKAVSEIPGVLQCSVNLLTNSMTVEGDVGFDIIAAAVSRAGYEAVDESISEKKNEIPDDKTKGIKYRLISSIIVLIVLMYFSMGNMMWGFPVPEFFDGNYLAQGILQLMLTSIVMVINQRFFISGVKGLINKSPNMDTLVSLGAGAAFIYSSYALFKMTEDAAKAHFWLHDMYFESAAMILTLITVGKMLESRAKGKTTNAIASLINLAPKTAVIIKDGIEQTVPIDMVKKGDSFVVRPGESIPVDGVVAEGITAVDESALTGESIPVDKKTGDSVFAATINRSGFIVCEATRVGEDTSISKIIKMVEDASAMKAPIAKVADKVSGVFVPVVMAIAAITTLIWLFSGSSIGYSLARGISVLVISCPCALGLATPVAIMVGNGVGAKCGILFKTATSLEETGRAKIVALDKTGTITEGEPEVVDIIAEDRDELLSVAYSLELKSEHPLAKAVVRYANEHNVKSYKTSEFEVLSGSGIRADISGEAAVGGNLRLVSKYAEVCSDITKKIEELSKNGMTPLLFSKGGKILGIISVADKIKKDSREAIANLQNMGIRVVMITGDNENTAKAIGDAVGVDEVIAGVLPDGKEQVIRDLKKKGKVIMVGDGINDAPALTSADIGMAIGAGTDIAIDAADVVLMKNTLLDVSAGIMLSKKTLKNIYENLFWAFIYNVVGIPLAAGVLIPITGWQINPMFGAAAMSLSSFCVVTNALRLNFAKIYNKKEKKTMKTTLKIEGMMCPHCEARVKKCLEEISGVTEAVVSHKEGTALVSADDSVSYDTLKNAVIEQGYKVLD